MNTRNLRDRGSPKVTPRTSPQHPLMNISAKQTCPHGGRKDSMLVTDKSTLPINGWRKTRQNRDKQKITHNKKEQETDSGSTMTKSMETKIIFEFKRIR